MSNIKKNKLQATLVKETSLSSYQTEQDIKAYTTRREIPVATVQMTGLILNDITTSPLIRNHTLTCFVSGYNEDIQAHLKCINLS